MWREGTLALCWWDCKLVQPLQNGMEVLQKVKLEPSTHTVTILGSSLQKWKMLTLTSMFTATLFTLAKI